MLGLIHEIRGELAAPYWWIAGASFIVAIFLVWRDTYRQAHPYDEETFRSAQLLFDALTEEEKATFEQLAIEKIMPGNKVLNKLEGTAPRFVKRDFTLGTYSISSDYSQIVPRLVKEWRAKTAKARHA